MLRKVITVTAEDSPNVVAARKQLARGEEPSGERVFPGVLSWDEFVYRDKVWDEQRKSVGLHARWYTGPELYLFSKTLMDEVVRRALGRPPISPTRYMGIDPAEGGDRSAWVVIDQYGVLELVSEKTPNTTSVYYRTLDLMNRWNIAPHNVCIDRGTGKAHADRLEENGKPVRTVSFGESVTLPIVSGMRTIGERVDVKEDQTIYRNRRVEMYWEAAALLNRVMDDVVVAGGDGAELPVPQGNKARVVQASFSIPQAIADWRWGDRKTLRQQLEAIPREYDQHGRPYLRPKSHGPGQGGGVDGVVVGGKRLKSIGELTGHSPDEADAFVLALLAYREKPRRVVAGVS